MGDLGLIPELGGPPEEGKSYPLQHSGLENSMDCTVHGVAKNQTQLSNFHFHFLISLSLNALTFMKSNYPLCLEETTKSLHLVGTWYHVGHLEETMAKALDTVPASEGLASPRGWKGEQTAGRRSSMSTLRKLQHARVKTIWGGDREMTLGVVISKLISAGPRGDST